MAAANEFTTDQMTISKTLESSVFFIIGIALAIMD